MNVSKKFKKASIFLVTIAVALIAIFGAFTILFEKPVEAEPQLPEKHLFVEEIYLLKTEETNTTINITCTPYLTNIWSKESGKIKIVAYVVKESNKVADCKNTVLVGKINADSTKEIEIPLMLSDDAYQVDILIFEDEKLVLKGSLKIKTRINLKTVYTYDDSGDVIDEKVELCGWTVSCEGGSESFSHVTHKYESVK